MRPSLEALDHLVLTVVELDVTVEFYTRVLGMTPEIFVAADGSTRTAMKFGRQKINLHPSGESFEPRAASATPGAADLCFLTDASLTDWVSHLAQEGVPVIDGPTARKGATGPLMSLYIRDPDGNLIEIASPA